MKTSFDKSQDIRIIKTKKAIIEALWKLLFDRSLNEISITDICRLAHVNRSTFYLHFEDKEQLFMQSIYDAMHEIDRVAASRCKTKDIYEYYKIIGDLTFDILTENKMKYRVLFEHNDSNLFLEPAQSFLSNNIIRHIKFIDKSSNKLDLPASLIAEFYSGGIISLCKWWVCTNMEVKQEKLRALIRILLSSFLTVTDYNEFDNRFFENLD